jgi:ribosomal protein L20A (L18A)
MLRTLAIILFITALIAGIYYQWQSMDKVDQVLQSNGSRQEVKRYASVTENDVKQFVYQWFAWLDHLEEDRFFLSHLSEEDLEIRLPEVIIKSRQGFREWYYELRARVKQNRSSVDIRTIRKTGEGWIEVTMNVVWRINTKDGQMMEETSRQTWYLQQDSYNRLVILRIIKEER